MNKRKAFLFFAVAAVAAVVICKAWQPASYVDQLVRIQAEQQLANVDDAILSEPVAVQGLLLDYIAVPTTGRLLVLKAWMALSRYQDNARAILLAYGAEPEFKDILLRYGEAVIPVIQYFRDNHILTVAAMGATANAVASTKATARRLWNGMTGSYADSSNTSIKEIPRDFGPTERGWYAVNFIRDEGHDFLGQFVEVADKSVKWNQTDRALKAITSFFTSGIRALETKHDLGEVQAGDLGWAALDVAVIAAPLKLFRAGKLVAPSGERLSLAARTRIFAPRLISNSALLRIGKYGAVATTVYIVVTHPGLINSVFAEAATLMGVEPWLVQFAGWFLIIAIALYPFSWVIKALARILLAGFSWLDGTRKKSGSMAKAAASDSLAA